MSDELRPPEGAEDGSLHWLAHPHSGVYHKPYQWDDKAGRWIQDHSYVLAEHAHEMDWHYHAPARPDDATERARLEGEVARLRRALDSIAGIPLGPDKGSAQWQIDCAAEIAREALRHDR